MPSRPCLATSLSLIGCGAVACFCAGQPLVHDASLRLPPNPLGIKMSPYGEIFAMAMQGPIDLCWHAGSNDCHDPNCTQHDHHHEHAAGTDHQQAADSDHDQEGTRDHREVDPTLVTDAPPAAPRSLRTQYRAFLEGLGEAVIARTNPRSATEAHKLFLRRRIEDKLRFAYQLDPAHYGNYSSYHFFITEPQVGTRPELTKGAKDLADSTIAYCLAQTSDPRPALTAAAAAQNVLELMFIDPARYPTSAMREQLTLTDRCLARYRELLDQALKSGQWDLLSPLRQDEAADRYRFQTRVREAAEATIRRFEGLPPTQQAASH